MADISGLVLTVVGVSFNLVSSLYAYAKEVKDARNDIQQLSNELFALIGVLERLKIQQGLHPIKTTKEQDFPSPPTPTGLRRVLHETLDFLEEIERSLATPTSRLHAKIQRMKWPLKDSETKQHLQRLERVKTFFVLCLMTDEIDLTRQISSQITELSNILTESRLSGRQEDSRGKYQKIMEWLSPVDPHQSYEKTIKSRTPGSGVWFTHSPTFKAWRDSRATSFFWLNGITGAGKTTLMTTALETMISMQDQTYGLAYFYCSFAESESLDSVNILGSILAQLCEYDDKNYEKLGSLYDASVGKSHGMRRTLDVAQLVDLIIQQIHLRPRTYILLDGLNECSDPYDIVKSLEIVATSVSSKNSIHIFMSSINEKGIEGTLLQMPNVSIETLHQKDIKEDVTILIQASLKSHPRLQQHTPELKVEITRALIDGAQGMFRWVYCQLDLLARLRTPGAVREALASLPPTLDKTYEGLLARVDGDEDRKLTREILEILAFSFRPLKLQEICEMLQLTPGLSTLDESKRLTDPKDVLSICGSLLGYRKDTGLVMLAHQSVKTYLTSHLKEGAWFSRLSEPEAHRRMAMKCLTYLSLDVFSYGPCGPGDLSSRYVNFPLLLYASEYWPKHMQVLEKCGHEELGKPLQEILKSFLFSYETGRGNFSAWVQLLIPSSKNIEKTQPLYYAASYGLVSVAELILESGADLECAGGRGGATPLNIASFRGHLEVVKLLLRHGANPLVRDESPGLNAIQWARTNGHRDVVSILSKSDFGRTERAAPGEDDCHRQIASFAKE